MTNYAEIKKTMYNSTYLNEGDFESIPLSLDIVKKESDREYVKTYYESKLSNVLDMNKSIEKNLKEIKDNLSDDIEFLNYKISKAVEKLRGSILAERNTTSTIYSTIVPITKEETNQQTTTATISDNIVFGISSSNIDDTLVTPLVLQNLNFKNLNIRNLNKNSIEELVNFEIGNKTHNSVPLEFTIDLRGVLKTSSLLILNMKDLAILEIYINNSLYQEKKLSNYFNIPVDASVQSVTIRSYPTLHKSSKLYFNILGITDLIYQEDCIFESKKLPINKNLTNLVLDVCDNSKLEEVEIDYFLSINGNEYEKVNPATKQSNKYDTTLQSIIKLSKDIELDLISISGTKKTEGDIQFPVPEFLQNFLEYETYVYFLNENKEIKSTYYFLVKQDIVLNKQVFVSPNSTILLDDKIIVDDNINLYKGIRKFEVLNGMINNYSYLENIIGINNIFIDKLLLPIYKNTSNNKYLSLSLLEIMEITNDTKIPNLYIKNVNQQITINTLKFKAILKSLDQKTIPYISRILLRGI